jgi:hypothetical protein
MALMLLVSPFDDPADHWTGCHHIVVVIGCVHFFFSRRDLGRRLAFLKLQGTFSKVLHWSVLPRHDLKHIAHAHLAPQQ